MILYLLKTTICLALLLAVYHLFLEREKMYRFNRFYLLFSIAFALLVPFNSITVYTPAVAQFQGPILTNQHFQSFAVTQAPSVQNWRDLIFPGLFGFYVLIAVVLLFRYLKNIYRILQRVIQNEMLFMPGATIVLLEEQVISHTFFHYIFINKDQYRQQRLEREVLLHEMAHVRQKHTLDVLFVGLVQVLFWFNPIIILYKKAIRLNHEFLADDAVISAYADVKHYQLLLINAASLTNIVPFASSFNYEATKKRLLMMTKTQNRYRAMVKKGISSAALLAAVYMFSTRVEAMRVVNTEPRVITAINRKPKIKPAEINIKLVEPTKQLPTQSPPIGPTAQNIREQQIESPADTIMKPVMPKEFSGGLVMADSTISLYITKYTNRAQLKDFKKQLAEMNISLDMTGVRFDAGNHLQTIDISANCHDGFSGSAGADFKEHPGSSIGFYRTYKKGMVSPFGTGRMPPPVL